MEYVEVLRFWFEGEGIGGIDPSKPFWFKKDKKVDAYITEHFKDDLENAKRGELDNWAERPKGRLALIILLDQFSRNIYRDRPEAFAGDAKALKLALEGIDRGDLEKLSTNEKVFFCMPLMHSENPAMQERSIEEFEKLAKEGSENIKWARMHKEIIDKYGRYPHRNKILGRRSTPEEEEYLSQPGAGF